MRRFYLFTAWRSFKNKYFFQQFWSLAVIFKNPFVKISSPAGERIFWKQVYFELLDVEETKYRKITKRVVLKKFVLHWETSFLQAVAWKLLQVRRIMFWSEKILSNVMRGFYKSAEYANVFWKTSPLVKAVMFLKNLSEKSKNIFSLFS